MSFDDVVTVKIEAIERCLLRIREEYQGHVNPLANITVLDSITLNLQRACESSIDLAMHCVRKLELGVPKTSREAFQKLREANHLSPELSDKMQKMVGFRNIAIHEYQELNTDILQAVVEKHLVDFEDFCEVVAGLQFGK